MRMQTVRQLMLSAALITGLLTSGVLSPRAATAATYYVATTGNDAYLGTEAQPFQTIRQGLSVLTAGDTLYLRGGTYVEHISSGAQTIPSGTSWSNAVTIAAYPGETVVLQGSIYLVASYIQYLIFDGLIVDGGAVYLALVNYVRLQNGEIKNVSQSGITTWFASQTNYNEFLNLKVYNNGRGFFDHGIYLTTGNNLVEGCDIYSNSGYGIHIYNGTGSGTDNNVIRNNTVHDNGISSGSGGIIISDGVGNLVYKNVIYNNFGGIDVYRNSTNTQVYDNIIYNNWPSAGIEVSPWSVGAIIQNNSLDQNGSGIVDTGVGTMLIDNRINP